MTTAGQVPFRQVASLTLGVLDQIKAIVLDAAREDDAGRWGIDGWVRLIHNLLDLQMRTYANVVDIAMAGPSSWQRDADTEPGPSLPVRLDTARPIRAPSRSSNRLSEWAARTSSSRTTSRCSCPPSLPPAPRPSGFG